ncbi:MAG: hypothetical protein HS100_04405 [Anaerolineales bacterium]|nr:hypothetical protein [Anaerolineales bacterium]
MDNSVFNQPTPEQLNAFVVGDPIAINEVVELLLPQIVRWSIKQYRNLPQDEVESMTHQVFAEVCINHARYEPHKAKLTTFVIRLLKLRLADLYQDVTEISRAEDSSLDISEKLLKKPYNTTDTLDSETHLVREAFFREAVLFLDPHEQDFLEMMLKGEKRQEIFVDILTRHGYQMPDPDRVVKNVKERLIRRLRSLADDAGYSLQDLLG